MQFRRPKTVLGALSALALAGAGIVAARGQGGAPVAPMGGAGSFEISGVKVDVSGKSADIARQGGWRIAQRKGWSMLSQQLTGKPGSLSDSALDSIVTGIVVEREQIGPSRYIASLGVQFDRAKAGSILGVSIAVTHSPPMLLVPLQYSGGVGQVFERDTAWARAWNRLRAAGSTIDYVRLRGTGADRLLVNTGQTLRHGRNWWRTILDQYGAVDMLVAEVQLRRDYPGGPIVGIFSATHGPEKVPVTSFALRIDNGDAIDALFDTAVARIDKAYQTALTDGRLHTDAVLAARPPIAQPAAPAPEETPLPTPLPSVEASGTTAATTSLSVQVETPNAAAVNASETAVRGVPGVRSATTTSLALGGISVMRVSFDGSQAALRAALEARGWSVQEGAGVLRIRRGATPQASPTPKAQ